MKEPLRFWTFGGRARGLIMVGRTPRARPPVGGHGALTSRRTYMHHRLLAATAAVGLAGAAFGAGLATAAPVADPVGDNCKDQGGFVACSNDILSVDAAVDGTDAVFTITTNPAPHTALPPDFPAHDFFWPSIALNFTNPVFTVNNPDRQIVHSDTPTRKA